MECKFEEKATEWAEIPTSQRNLGWLLKPAHPYNAAAEQVCYIGFGHSCTSTSTVERSTKPKLNTSNTNNIIGEILIDLVDKSPENIDLEEQSQNILNDAVLRLMSTKKDPLGDDYFPTLNSPRLSEENMRVDNALLNSGSTEHAHHSREKEDEFDVTKSGAPSPASFLSYGFPNDSYSFNQFDCQSDFTESTGRRGNQTPMSANVNNTPGRRARNFSDDASFDDLHTSDRWDHNDTLSTQSNHAADQNYTLDESDQDDDGASEHEREFGGFQNPRHFADHSAASRATNTLLELSETSEYIKSSPLCAGDVFADNLSPIAKATSECSPRQRQNAGDEQQQQDAQCIDALVMPTVLSASAKSVVLRALHSGGVEVRCVHR